MTSGFYGYQVHGTDVCRDVELTQRLTALEQLQAGMHVYAAGPMGETLRVLVDNSHGSTWCGRAGHMHVFGAFQPTRYQHVVGGTPGGWAATVFGDTRALARADFS